MATKIIDTNQKPQVWKIGVETKSPQKIRVKVSNAKKPFTFYTDRYKTVNGKVVFTVRMPQTPDVVKLEVFNQDKGNLADGKDGSFSIFQFDKLPIETDYSVFDYNAKSKSFIKFLQWFSENASILSAGKSIYKSPDGMFEIQYLDCIRDYRHKVVSKDRGVIDNPNYGRIMKTPARISRNSGVIDIGKNTFISYSVPMRMIVLLHEISHFYLNDKDTDEIEADINALRIYLGLGYPRIEAIQAFASIFYTSNTPLNKKRMEVIMKVVQDYEKTHNKLTKN